MTGQNTPLTGDEVAMLPIGYRYTILAVCYLKRLLQFEMKPAERLDWLEKLNSMTDSYITPDLLAALQPMSDTETKMIDQAMQLDGDSPRDTNAYKLLTSQKIFPLFLDLNPSIAAAIRLRDANAAARACVPSAPN